jgi:hypothetical protein
MQAEHIVGQTARGQNVHEIPCAALAQTLQGLLRTGLVQSKAELGARRQTLVDVVGSNGLLAGDLVIARQAAPITGRLP